VDVLAERPKPRLPVASPNADDRELPVERHDFLGELVLLDRLGCLREPLSLAVVAQPPRLHERREPRLVERAEAGGRDPERAEELLLTQSVLTLVQGSRPWQGPDPPRRRDRDVLELEGDGIRAVDEPVERAVVAVLPDDELADRLRARIRRRVEEAEGEPERQPGEPEHAPELTAADAGDEGHRLQQSVASREWLTRRGRPGRGARAPRPSARTGSGADARRARRPIPPGSPRPGAPR
jgi:hypothetical protein